MSIPSYRPPGPDPLVTHRVESYRVELLNRKDEVLGDLDGVTGGSVEMNANATLRISGNLDLIDQGQNINFSSDRVRIWWQVQGVEPWPLGVYLLDQPSVRMTDEGREWEIGLIDKLAVLQDAAVEQPFSLPAGTVVTTAVRDLILSTGETRLAVTESAEKLASMRVWEAGTSLIRIINDLLSDINYWALWTDGQGQFRVEPYVRPEYRPIMWDFHEGAASIHTPEWVRVHDLGEVPNKVILISQAAEDEEALVATATNSNPESLTSTVTRGRVIAHVEDGVEVANQATLQSMAERKLLDLSAPAASLEVDHAPVPLWYNDAVTFQSQGHSVTATVTKMSMNLVSGTLVAAEWRELDV